MRISLLLQREPFGQLLEDTLSHYWTAETGRAVQVRWRRREAGDQIWQGNAYLNFFCVANVDRVCFDVILREFSYARAAWRRAAQSWYAHAAVRAPFRSWFSQVEFGVSHAIQDAEGKLVIGGNHRLRIIQPFLGRSTVIHKAGYSRLSFEREVNARTGPASALAPRFDGMDANGLAFSEQFFAGTPANRMAPKRKEAARESARSRIIAEIHRPTMRVLRLGEHVATLVSACSGLSAVCGDAASEMSQWTNAIAGGAPIGVCFSHGDLQDGNILADGDRLYVIDWEAATYRSQLYDLATFDSGVRLAANPFQTWRMSVSNWVAGAPVVSGLEVLPDSPDAWRAHAAVWWLEESLLRLEESHMAQHVQDHSAADERIAHELRQALAHLRTL